MSTSFVNKIGFKLYFRCFTELPISSEVGLVYLVLTQTFSQ
jgi:hypothetical protein